MNPLLPAAVDFQSDARRIDERRPPWLARGTLYAVVAVIATAIVWASLARVDRIVVAPGKLVTTAQTIVLQPLETALVRSLSARVGDVVHKGDVLATLDPTFSEADAAQLRDRIATLRPQVERLQAELAGQPYAPSGQDQQTRLQVTIWSKGTEEYRAKVDAFDQQVREVAAAITTKEEDHAALTRRLAIAQEIEDMRASLMQREVGSKVNYLDAEAQRMQVERDMQLAANETIELHQKLKHVAADKAAYIAEFRRKVAEELVKAREDREAAAKQLEKAARRAAVTVLTAPADAIVLDVAERSVGSVMREAEPLYTLVPLDSPLEADVRVDGGDVGHVAAGAGVQLKLAAWPFQRYGTLSGTVRTLSENSFGPEAAKSAGGGSEHPEPPPYFKARVALETTTLRAVPASFRLIPGMSVTAEINAGQRSVLSYLMYPLMRGIDESLREP